MWVRMPEFTLEPVAPVLEESAVPIGFFNEDGPVFLIRIRGPTECMS